MRFLHEGREQTLTCDWVMGCDDFHGIARDTFPAEVSRTYETRRPPFDADWMLRRGPITAKYVSLVRSYVHEPLRHGRLLLAGGAAHIVLPTGAKGLSLAVSDVRRPRPVFAEWRRTGSAQLLASHSDLCLSRVWQGHPFFLRHD